MIKKVNIIVRYMQFHPLAYIVKLNIELSMADLIGRIAKNKDQFALNDLRLTRSDSSATKLSRLRGRGTSSSGSLSGTRQRSFGFGGWNFKGKAAGDEFNELTRPNAAYTVNATASTDITDIESVCRNSKDIYTTREFRVDYEDMSSGSRDSHGAITSRNEYDDACLLNKD